MAHTQKALSERAAAMKEAAPARRTMTVDEFSRAYGIGVTKTYAEIKAGRLRLLKVGGKSLIRVEDAESWLASLPTK